MQPFVVGMLSGGIGSYSAIKRYGRADYLMFADTMIEDDDLYRFIIQASADIFGAVSPDLSQYWNTIPPLDKMDEQKSHLKDFALTAMKQIDGLLWLQDGRTPWDVFRDSRFIGNSRIARCSHDLKQEVCRQYLETNFDPQDTLIILGIDWQEAHRFNGRNGKPGSREKWLPWKAIAPLCELPHIGKYDLILQLERNGIDPPRLYGLGFPHNNCGGFCVKSGQAGFRRLLENFPDRYNYHERQEQELRAYLKTNAAIMCNRRDGSTTPLPMIEFREQYESSGACDMTDRGGCGCFSEGV